MEPISLKVKKKVDKWLESQAAKPLLIFFSKMQETKI